MNSQMKYGLVGLLIGGVAVGLSFTSVFNSNKSNFVGNSNNQQVRLNTMDAHFIEQMIPHHEDAITMAKIARAKSQRPEVRKLAEEIIDSQGKEINQMKKWYESWFGGEVPVDNQVMDQHGMGGNGMHMGMMGDEADIERLSSAEDFDKEFVEQMIPHHQMAVMMANMLKNGTQKTEMKRLADEIISAQIKEIDQMRQWLKEWSN